MNEQDKIKELDEQNKFLKHILKSFEDIKKGRLKEFELSNT